LHYFGFTQGFNSEAIVLPNFREAQFYVNGLWYSATILAILGCHEMGHYVACRYYRVDASLPFFLPAPLPLTGTLGAFIRIRARIPSRTALFDIGLSGPIAGFVVAVPALFIGLALSAVERLPENFEGVELGEPLLFRAAAWLVWGDVGDGMSINMHPMAFAAWFGLLATALNLFPIGQLDGGHVTYAVLGRRSTVITLLMIVVAVALTTFVSSSWMVWTILMVVMLLAIGPHHPPTLDDHSALGPARVALAVVGLIMLIVCFTPAPIEPFVTGQ
jgi:membrane-associated protease RseP (regulator of RpoE activity)